MTAGCRATLVLVATVSGSLTRPAGEGPFPAVVYHSFDFPGARRVNQ